MHPSSSHKVLTKPKPINTTIDNLLAIRNCNKQMTLYSIIERFPTL